MPVCRPLREVQTQSGCTKYKLDHLDLRFDRLLCRTLFLSLRPSLRFLPCWCLPLFNDFLFLICLPSLDELESDSDESETDSESESVPESESSSELYESDDKYLFIL